MRSDQQISMLDDIQSELHSLQLQFSSRRGLSFMMNPMASRRLEQFANNSAVTDAAQSTNSNSNLNGARTAGKGFNPNALIQQTELVEMKEAIVEVDEEDSDDDELVLAIDSIQEKITRISNPRPSTARIDAKHSKVQILMDARVARASHVQQSRISIRKSVLRIADDGTRKRNRSKVRG